MSDVPDALADARAALADRRYLPAHRSAIALLRREPDNVAAIAIKAAAELGVGQAQAAEASLRHALAIDPAALEVADDLARLLAATGRGAEGEALLRHAIAEYGGTAAGHAMLGSRLSSRGALAAGEWHLRRAVALGDEAPATGAALGHNLLRQGRVAEAEPLLAAASAALPEDYATKGYFAVALERLGRLEDARAALDHARPGAARAGFDLATQEARLLGGTAAWRDGLALLENDPDLPPHGLLERGRLRDRAGDHAGAWRDYVAGKEAMARQNGLAYSREDVDAHAARLAGFFTAERFARLPRAPRRSEVPQPLFIFGFPRSGTTLVEQLLTSHSSIRAGDELPFAGELIEFVARNLGSFPDGLAALAIADRHHVATLLRDFYLARAEQHGLLAPGADFFTDKMPLNEMFLPLLRIAFPDSPMVAVRRHPLDILVSVMSHTLTHGFNCGFRLADAAHHLATVDGLLARWEAVGGDVYRLGYEQLIADQDGETKRLMAHVGLAVEQAQARFHASTRIAATPSYAAVRQPLNDRAIARWRHHADALAPIVPELADVLARGGYTV